MSSLTDLWRKEALELAKIVRNKPDIRCFDRGGRQAYQRRVKVQKWLDAAVRLAVLVRALDNWITEPDNDVLSLPTAWRPMLIMPRKKK